MQIVSFWWAPSEDTVEGLVTVGVSQESRWEQTLFSVCHLVAAGLWQLIYLGVKKKKVL